MAPVLVSRMTFTSLVWRVLAVLVGMERVGGLASFVLIVVGFVERDFSIPPVAALRRDIRPRRR